MTYYGMYTRMLIKRTIVTQYLSIMWHIYIETFDNPMDKTSMLRMNEFVGLTDKEFIASQNISRCTFVL